MTVGEWLDGRLTSAPDPLAVRLRALLEHDLAREADDLPEVATGRAAELVACLLADGCTTRDGALDLLAADALVTYAFERAADAPDALAERARAAMMRLATTAGGAA